MLFEEAHEVYPFVNAKCRYQGAASPYGMLVSFFSMSLWPLGPGKTTGDYSIKQQW